MLNFYPKVNALELFLFIEYVINKLLYNTHSLLLFYNLYMFYNLKVVFILMCFTEDYENSKGFSSQGKFIINLGYFANHMLQRYGS